MYKFWINVSKNGYHEFATELDSITDYQKAERLTKEFKEKFPESEGYKVDCYRNTCFNEKVNL